MNRYYTVMIVPERDKGVRSFKIPRIVFRSAAFLLVICTVVIGILVYDYWQIIQQVYQNKHLTIENRQLREQIQLFQMKINSLSDDIRRVQTFENKLRVITGLENIEERQVTPKGPDGEKLEPDYSHIPKSLEGELYSIKSNESIKQEPQYKDVKDLYDQKIAAIFGLQTSYTYTKTWSKLTEKSFGLSEQFALFDYKFQDLKSTTRQLEISIHELDQYLLDKDSVLKSTPTILPSQGWITSYYGPRNSPVSGRLKMHEGLDIGAKTGTPIVSPADGVVTFSGHKAGFGKFVQIDHGYGIETIYGHAHKLLIKSGAKVKRGELIAQVGNTGLSTAPHLHYEVRVNGIAVDPLYFTLQ